MAPIENAMTFGDGNNRTQINGSRHVPKTQLCEHRAKNEGTSYLCPYAHQSFFQQTVGNLTIQESSGHQTTSVRITKKRAQYQQSHVISPRILLNYQRTAGKTTERCNHIKSLTCRKLLYINSIIDLEPNNPSSTRMTYVMLMCHESYPVYKLLRRRGRILTFKPIDNENDSNENSSWSYANANNERSGELS